MPPYFTLQQICTAIEGHLVGDDSLPITRLAHPADIRDANDLALAMDKKLLPLLKDRPTQPTVIAAADIAEADFLTNFITIDRPRLALAKLTGLFAEPVTLAPGIHPSAVIEPGAILGQNAAIGAFVYIGKGARIGDNAAIHPQAYIGENAEIGENALIYAGVKIGAGTRIGANTIIHFNASIGADGFSFVTPQIGSVESARASGGKEIAARNDTLIRIASLAPVIIGDDVEIGACSSIDRGTIASTRIGNGTKIDNQAQIGHNVTIGDHCMICGRVGIAGSAKIGHRVVVGGASGIGDHLTIGDDAIIMGMSGVAGNVVPRTIVGGSPAMPRDKAMENLFNVGRLRQFFKKIEELGKRIDSIESE